MASKGAHTLVEALVNLKEQGVEIQGHLAGDTFQAGYREKLEEILRMSGLDEVRFTGQLNKSSLARFFRLHHICVFPSIHPEAFGIVAAEMMASGLAVVSSRVGGAGELVQHESTGLAFTPGNTQELVGCLARLAKDSELISRLSGEGRQQVEQKFSVLRAAQLLELGFIQDLEKTVEIF